MCKYIKTLILTLILSMMICAQGMAKTVWSNDGRACFTTPDNWYLTSVGGDAATTELLTVARDKDTCASLKRSNFALGVSSFRELSYAEKSEFRDNTIRNYCNYARSKGYDITVGKTEIADDVVFISYVMFKNGVRFLTIETFVIKDYYCYSLSMIATDYTAQEAVQVCKSFRLDGMPLSTKL